MKETTLLDVKKNHIPIAKTPMKPDHRNDRNSNPNRHMTPRVWQPHTNRPPRDTSIPTYIPTSMNTDKAQAILDFTCYNCGEKGHKVRDCKKTPQPKAHLQAAHMEGPSRYNDNGNSSEDDGGNRSSITNIADEENHDKELIEIEIPDSNDYYENADKP
jgi:hypothetical protein